MNLHKKHRDLHPGETVKEDPFDGPAYLETELAVRALQVLYEDAVKSCGDRLFMVGVSVTVTANVMSVVGSGDVDHEYALAGGDEKE
jgi:hypothetical protein